MAFHRLQGSSIHLSKLGTRRRCSWISSRGHVTMGVPEQETWRRQLPFFVLGAASLVPRACARNRSTSSVSCSTRVLNSVSNWISCGLSWPTSLDSEDPACPAVPLSLRARFSSIIRRIAPPPGRLPPMPAAPRPAGAVPALAARRRRKNLRSFAPLSASFSLIGFCLIPRQNNVTWRAEPQAREDGQRALGVRRGDILREAASCCRPSAKQQSTRRYTALLRFEIKVILGGPY